MTNPSNKTHHIFLDSKGYILLDESYALQSQTPFNPRFSTGDTSYGDLSYWQFLNQASFIGGQGQENFNDTTKYWQSVGWNIRNGKPKIASQLENLSLTNALPVRSIAGTSTTDTFTDTNYSADPVWTVRGGATWSAAGAKLVMTTMTGSHEISTPSTYTTAYWAFDMLHTSNPVGENEAADLYVLFMSSTDNVATTNGYCVMFAHNVGLGVMQPYLYKVTAGAFTLIGAYSTYVDGDTSHAIRINRSSTGVVELLCDSVSLGELTDTTFTASNYFAIYEFPDAESILDISPEFDNFVFAATGSGSANVGHLGELIHYNNELWLAYVSTAAAFTITELKARADASNIPEIRHISAQDICVITRDGAIGGYTTFLFAVTNNVLKIYTGTSVAATINLTVFGTCIHRVSSTAVVVAGTTATNSGIPIFELITFTANALTVASQKLFYLDGSTAGVMCNSSAIDSNGTHYFAFNDMSDSAGVMPGRIIRITSTDMTATNPTISAIEMLPNFVVRGLASIGGTIYLFGAKKDGNDVINAVMQYPSTILYESSHSIDLLGATSAELLNHGIPCFFQESGNFLFLSRTDENAYYSILETNGTVVRECAAFNVDPFSINETTMLAIAEWSGRYYVVDAASGVITRTTASPGSISGSTPTLQFSNFGANTELINKSLYSMTLELSEALTDANVLSVYVNDILIGTMTAADGTIKEMPVDTEITGRWFAPKIVSNVGCTWPGYIEGFTAKYIPTQLKKLAWSFAIRADRHALLLNGQREQRTPAEILADLKAVWSSNIPKTFIDTDGNSYQVIMTSFKARQPLVANDRGEREYLIPVELLEV